MALSQDKKSQNWNPITDITCMQTCLIFFVVAHVLECKTVPIFAYSTFCLTVRVRVLELQVSEQWNKRSGPRLKTESETGRDAKNTVFFSRTTGVWDSSASRAWDSLAILTLKRFWEKEPTVLLSTRVHFRYFSQKREITFDVATFGGVLFSGGSLLSGFPNTSEFYYYFRAAVTSGTLRNLSFESTFLLHEICF